VDPLKKALPELDIADEAIPTEGEEKIVELYAPDEGTGLVIEAGESWAYMLVPLSRHKNPDQLWNSIWPCLEAMEFHTGLTVYDPQLDKILDSRIDKASVVQKFSEMVSSRKLARQGGLPVKAAVLKLILIFVGWIIIAFLTQGLPFYVTVGAVLVVIIVVNLLVGTIFRSRKKESK
jgi:hypothetical protein